MTPKQRFQQTGNLASHRRTVESMEFERACDAAMLQLVDDLCIPVSLEGAAPQHWRIQGAKDFLQILLHIADLPAEPPLSKVGQLNHAA